MNLADRAARRPAFETAPVRYGLAVLAVGLALILKLLLVPVLRQDIPVLGFFVAVTVSAWMGGLGPGIFATILAAALDFCYFMEPFGRMQFVTADQAPRLVLFVLEGLCVSYICSRL